MSQRSPRNQTGLPDYKIIAEEYARAKRAKEAAEAGKTQEDLDRDKKQVEARQTLRKAAEIRRKKAFEARWWWALGFWSWLLVVHAAGIFFFTSGFLLTRHVLTEQSACKTPPVELSQSWKGQGTVEGGCWHPKSFDKAVVIIIDALRYDFTVPVDDQAPFHNAFPFLHETAVSSPDRAFLRPFIADPPTATLQRLKGLTTGTLPTFIDLGSNFAGTAIDEDNLLMQMKNLGKRVVHLGDDTWLSLFPGYFEPNISRAYDSFQVWDLHTVDNGVIEHMSPLLQHESKGSWDVLIGHLLGVDHAGHRYGPDHSAMTAKLQQMDGFIRDVASKIDDNTVLIVMGDHGMDGKGDHGGESDDEVEAALWMYSKRPFFGRTQALHIQPPATAKERPVNQIDLVPTLALLLGLPIPFNNLGAPIEEAFAGIKGAAWDNLATVTRMTAAGIQRYQEAYFAARGFESTSSGQTTATLKEAQDAFATKTWTEAYKVFAAYQQENLRICKDLWARFDVPKMGTGITIMVTGLLALLAYSSRDEEEDFATTEDIELDFAERKLELLGEGSDSTSSYKTLHREVVIAAGVGAVLGAGVGAFVYSLVGLEDMTYIAAAAVLSSTIAVLVPLASAGKTLLNILPNSLWGWLSVVFTVAQSAGFASNSYTIWEDSILLFFVSTFGAVSAIASFSIPSTKNRTLAVYHSVMFVVLGRAASFSKLCREEQMPYCNTTYYSSTTSSTSSAWQLLVPFVVALVLPSITKSFLTPSRSFEGLAPTWIGYIYRSCLFLAASYWVLDAADNGNWFPSLPAHSLKTIAVYLAQLVLALVFVAGSTAFVWAPPLVSVISTAAAGGNTQVTILGYGNTNGARFLLLPLNILAACILLSKPMGGGALTLLFWQMMSLLEILDLNDLTAESIGPVMLGVLGNFGYFKTGHQATLASLQWDSAFIPLFTIRYPWTPIVIALNTFAGQIVAAAGVPLVVLWKVGPKRRGVLESSSRALGAFVSYFAVECLATMAWAGHLRRHLMLYRVFSPRFMMGAALLLVMDLVGILVTLTGVRSNTLAIGEVFGFAD